ncbi:hypothetical protein JOB18_049676 [Solea senegalensis]|uniref:Telomere repeats-binding bouquet formation protein 2 n=1 Tax=Solea senegalensis TaxID=28829 RepID=A0AAV6Q7E9_SOLSE|nr:hypothetical protein JOB18_049676 [Solea senegalensis]
MFKSRSAWFSSSVSQECRTFWIQQGGTIAGWRGADYLFSEDAACADTLRIFESKCFLRDKVTVFHSLFLTTCEGRQSFKSVCIGHYVLPPASVQDEVRHVVGRLIWESEDESSEAECSQDEFTEGDKSRSNGDFSDTDSSDVEASLLRHLQDCPVRNMQTGYISMDALQKYSGDLCDFHPRCWQCCTSANMH